jgi:Transposase IS66 family
VPPASAALGGLGAVPRDRTGKHITLLRRGVAVGLSEVRRVPGTNVRQPPALMLLECLRDRQDDVLRFLTDTAIPPTNNQAERDARPAKTQQKISGRLRSEKTTRDRYAIRGYASTAGKHGHDIFTAIRDALAGNPWMPPISRSPPEPHPKTVTQRYINVTALQRCECLPASKAHHRSGSGSSWSVLVFSVWALFDSALDVIRSGLLRVDIRRFFIVLNIDPDLLAGILGHV